jgi:hypothetical protein
MDLIALCKSHLLIIRLILDKATFATYNFLWVKEYNLRWATQATIAVCPYHCHLPFQALHVPAHVVPGKQSHRRVPRHHFTHDEAL